LPKSKIQAIAMPITVMETIIVMEIIIVMEAVAMGTITLHTIREAIAIISSAIIILCGYGLFNSRFLLKGPEIAVAGLEESENELHTETKYFNLKGTAIHSSFISVNNRPISVDESGNFDDELVNFEL
jgi:hypothetical protein